MKTFIKSVAIAFVLLMTYTVTAQGAQTPKSYVTIQNAAPGGTPVSATENADGSTLKVSINRNLVTNDENKYIDVTLTVKMLLADAIPKTGYHGTIGYIVPLIFSLAAFLLLIFLQKKVKTKKMYGFAILLVGFVCFLPLTAQAQNTEEAGIVHEDLSEEMLKSFDFDNIIYSDGTVELMKKDSVVLAFKWNVNDLAWNEQKFIYRMALKDSVDDMELDKAIPVTDTSVLRYTNLKSTQSTLEFPYIAPKLVRPLPVYTLHVKHYLWDGTDASPISAEDYPGIILGQTYHSADYVLTNRPDLGYLNEDIEGWFSAPDVTEVTVAEGQSDYTLILYYGQKATFNVYLRHKELAIDAGDAGQSPNLSVIMGLADLSSVSSYNYTIYSGTLSEEFALNVTGYYIGQTVDLSTLNPPSNIRKPEIVTRIETSPGNWVDLTGNFPINDPQNFSRKLTAPTNDFYIEYKQNVEHYQAE